MEEERTINKIYLDYDEKQFSDVIASPIKESGLFRILQIAKKMHIDVCAVCIRSSSNGRLHVCVYLEKPISFVWSYIFRVRLDDCYGRLTSDLRRYLESGGDISLTNRVFNCKVSNGETKRAGEWITIYRNKTTTLKDFNLKTEA